jgi:hypothetical protein
MTLLRSAELCLEGGFRHFVIVEGRTDVRQEGYTTPVQVGYTRRGAYVYGGNSYNRVRTIRSCASTRSQRASSRMTHARST